jgi:predicted ferric reductase
MHDVWWYLSRATGIVATMLAVAALVWGFFFSARNTGSRRKPNWWLDLHNYLGGLTLVFTGAHLVAAYFDSNARIGLAQLLVPGTAKGSTWAVTWGVLGAYLFALAVFTSWPKRRLSRRTWRVLHLTSVLGVVFALLHAYQLGSDTTERWFEAGIVLSVAFGLYALMVRLFGVVQRLVQR